MAMSAHRGLSSLTKTCRPFSHCASHVCYPARQGLQMTGDARCFCAAISALMLHYQLLDVVCHLLGWLDGFSGVKMHMDCG